MPDFKLLSLFYYYYYMNDSFSLSKDATKSIKTFVVLLYQYYEEFGSPEV